LPNGHGTISTQEDEVPAPYVAEGGEKISQVGLSGHYEGTNHHDEEVVLDCVRELEAGEEIDFTPDIQPNYDFFEGGPGYDAVD